MKIFHLPDLGEGLTEAEIREWYVKVGDEVTVDQPLASMETAKAVVDVPSPYAGKIVELHGKPNDIIQTGAPLISFDIGEEATVDQGSVVGKLETSEQKWDDGNVKVGTTKKTTANIKIMPAARVLAAQMNIDLSLIKPTGPQGLITVDDVKSLLQQPKAVSALHGGGETLHGVRRTMAHIMMQAHQEVVPVTIVDNANITALAPKTDLTACLLLAMVKAAKAEPSLNAWFDGKALERKLFTEVNIGLAVDTAEGLFVPVIKNAEKKSATELRTIIDSYKNSVKDRSIAPADLQGATMTLSNFGMIAGIYATPIIVPPAVAILGCGRSQEIAMVREGKIEMGRILPLSLTFDHRAVTGGEATRFLAAVITSITSLRA